ncbi:hypothetical protein [Halarchaeum nitratireducens]|uniref:Uncharacterized protein n=1 Tax=Halarchaeum nitratireducens TaxID=489913 RepID=A0A830GBL4_9EURY|nr:hypothetical protein [Halarchaeum nitratireducens]GGN18752.1 hypothetical protein GCM10009021_19760 [Halarchaeum nitratireducens]
MATSSGGFASTIRAYKRISILSSVGLLVFGICGLVMTGLAQEAIDLLTRYKYLPWGASMAALAIVFMSSSTRDPRYYHASEWFIVAAVMLLLGAYAFLPAVQEMMATYSPWSDGIVLGLQIVVGAIVAR